MISVKVRLDGPIGIAHIGDPHIDSPGSDIATLEKHISIIKKTEGLLGANVGDSQDNWVGRLAHLYSKSTTSDSEVWKLIEWMIKEIPWLYIVGGNHDVWSGAGDPLKWITRQSEKMGVFENWQVRMGLKFPNDKVVRINCRHDFPGHSQWNAVHGPAKAVKMGVRDHILVCGHKHLSGIGIDKCPLTGLISNFVRVAGYKKLDDFAMKSGFLDINVSPACVTIIDPQYADDDVRLITVLHDVEEGADYLTWKRKRK